MIDRGHHGGRLARHRMLLSFAGGILAVGGITAAIVAIVAPLGVQPLCRPYAPCGAPPRQIKPLIVNSVWRSSALGFHVEYASDTWQVHDQAPTGVTFAYGDGSALLQLQGARGASPGALLQAKLSALGGNLLSLSRDADRRNTLLGTNVGLRPGPGGAYTGNLQTPQGVTPVWVDVMSATDGRVGIVATLVTQNKPGSDAQKQVAQDADSALKSVVWGP